MCSEQIRLRGGISRNHVHEIGKIPTTTIMRLARSITWHRCKNTNPKITGDEAAEYWADAIGGRHRNSPDGLDDVVIDGHADFAWSVKTIAQQSKAGKTCRLISGRCQPEFSFEGFKNSEHSVQEVGEKVLSIYNERVAATRRRHPDLRSLTLLRHDADAHYRVFEDDLYRISEPIHWRANKGGNFEGYDAANIHRFTWQPHGAQFTIIKSIPHDAVCFSVKEPGKIDRDKALEAIGYDDSWVLIT